MASFLSSWRHAIGHDAAQTERIRAIMAFAQRGHQSIELVPLKATDPDAVTRPWVATIELIEDDGSFVISQPSQGAIVHPLTTGERLHIVVRGPEGRYRGEVVVRGRATLASGAGGKFYGYRLSPTSDITLDERRFRHRLLLGFDIALDATIEPQPPADGSQPAFKRFRAEVTDVSIRGMRLRTALPPDGLVSGSRFILHVELPDPIVNLRLPGQVRHAAPSRKKDVFLIGVEFDEEVELLNEFIRRAEIRRRRRQKR